MSGWYSFEDIKSILVTALGDRQELSTYKCQLWQLNMSDGITLNKYYQRSKEIVQNEKSETKQDLPQPMDLGFTRSKLTLNRRPINNNEILEPQDNEDSDSEPEDLDLHFYFNQREKHET